jgi:hypothetical protein
MTSQRRMLQEVYNPSLCILYIFKLLWTSGRVGGGRKHQYQCGWGDWGKLLMII